MFARTLCTKSFTNKSHLIRHAKTHSGMKFACDLCPKTFFYKSDLTRHKQNVYREYFINKFYSLEYIFIFSRYTAYRTTGCYTDRTTCSQIVLPDIPAGPSDWDSDDDLMLC